MPEAIADACRRTGQPVPVDATGFARTIFDSLALKYRVVVEWLEELTGGSLTTIRVIGGGARNRLLNQLTADATGRVVIAGPVEATALGNLAMQLVATGQVAIAGRGARRHRALVSDGALRAGEYERLGAGLSPVPGLHGAWGQVLNLGLFTL